VNAKILAELWYYVLFSDFGGGVLVISCRYLQVLLHISSG